MFRALLLCAILSQSLQVAFAQAVTPADAYAGKFENFVELVVVPPFVEHDWSTPRKLFWSQVDNIINVALSLNFSAHKSAYGHAMVHLKCGEEEDIWTGYTGDRKGEGGRMALRDRAGLGTILHQYADAEVQDTPTVLKFIKRTARIEKALPHYLRMPISRAQCDVMKCHLNAFQNAKNTTYGFSARPMQYEGAGCTSYASSFFQIAGAFDPMFAERWGFNLEISSRLVGTSTLQPEHGFYPLSEDQPKGVSFRTVIKRNNGVSSWTFDGVPNYSLHIFEPGYMAKFIEEVEICSFNRSRCSSPELKKWVEDRGAWPLKNELGPSVVLTNPYFTRDATPSTACALAD